MENRKIVKCGSCNRRLGVPASKHIIFQCPHCGAKQELFYSGLFIPAEERIMSCQNEENADLSTRVVEILKKKIQKEFLIILN